MQRYGPVINYFPGSVLRYRPITNHGTGSVLRNGPPYALQFRLGSLADTLCEFQEGPSTPTQREAEDDPGDEMRARKKRAAAKQHELIEYVRWDRSELSEEDIDKKMRKILTDLNRDSVPHDSRFA